MASDQRAGEHVDGFAEFAAEMGWSDAQHDRARYHAQARALRGLPSLTPEEWAEWMNQ